MSFLKRLYSSSCLTSSTMSDIYRFPFFVCVNMFCNVLLNSSIGSCTMLEKIYGYIDSSTPLLKHLSKSSHNGAPILRSHASATIKSACLIMYIAFSVSFGSPCDANNSKKPLNVSCSSNGYTSPCDFITVFSSPFPR